MNVTVLGKYGPYEAPGNTACSCYLVEDGDNKIVLDMGPGSLAHLSAKTDINEIDYIFISHLHYDHTADFLAFRYLLEDLDHKVNFILEKSDSDYYKLLTSHKLINVIDARDGEEIEAGGFILGFYSMVHTVPTLGVKITGSKVLSYTGDTVYNDNIPKLIEKADFIIADCSKPETFKGPHMTTYYGKKIQKDSGAFLLSSHLSPGFDPSPDYEGFDKIETAQEMKTYEF